MLVPIGLASLPGLCRKPTEKPWSLHLSDQRRNVCKRLACEAIQLSILPYRAHCTLDAVVRTFYRLRVSRRSLLQWTTASEAEMRSNRGCRDHYELMWACTVLSLALAAWLAVVWLPALWSVGPVLLLWLLGPGIAWGALAALCPRRDPAQPARGEERRTLGTTNLALLRPLRRPA